MTKKDMLAAYERIREGGRKGGRKGGMAKTAAKAKAAQANGRRGGAPPTRPHAVRLAEIRERIDKGLSITPAQGALHYADKLGEAQALAFARRQRDGYGEDAYWWDAVIANLERGVR